MDLISYAMAMMSGGGKSKGYKSGGTLIYDYVIPTEILHGTFATAPEARAGVYEPYQWIYNYQGNMTIKFDHDNNDKFTQKYNGSGSNVGMTAILVYKIDPTKIKKINYDVTVTTPHHSNAYTNNSYKFNFYLTDTLSNALYNYATPQVPVLWRSELWNASNEGENVGSIVLADTQVTKPVYLAIGAPGWSYVVNSIEFEEV